MTFSYLYVMTYLDILLLFGIQIALILTTMNNSIINIIIHITFSFGSKVQIYEQVP